MNLKAVVLASALALGACVSPGYADPWSGGLREPTIMLTVINTNFLDARIDICWRSAVCQFALEVPGKTTVTTQLVARDDRATLRVDFIGARGYETEELLIWPGDHLEHTTRMR